MWINLASLISTGHIITISVWYQVWIEEKYIPHALCVSLNVDTNL